MENLNFMRSSVLHQRVVLLFIALFMSVSYTQAASYVPDKHISIQVSEGTFYDVVAQIEQQTGYLFLYKNSEIDESKLISLDLTNKSLKETLDILISSQNLTYQIEDNKHILVSQPQAKVEQNQSKIKISGIILDEFSEPMIGVNISEKGTSVGTITDLEGRFSIEVHKGATIRVSYIGFIEQLVVANESTSSLKIVLKEDNKTLEELIVIGYGTQKKSDVSGSVTSVSGDKIGKIPSAGTAEALQGMAPGLSINFGSGAPGSNPTLVVRGMTSWGSSNEPLVIIDGTPGDIAFLNPEDIKSMTVLKDAAMAAIYGSRAAAGVILIETNRGTMQAPRISFSAYVGMDDLPKRMRVCNSEEYIRVNKLALQNAGLPENRWPKYISAYEENPAQFADTDWQDEYYRRGFTQKYTVGYTAGNEIMNVAISGFYSDKEGIVIGTSSDQLGFRVNSDVKRGMFKVGESVSYGKRSYHPEANTGFPGMYQTTNIQPLIHLYDENNEGGYGGAIPGMGMTDAANPVAFNKLVNTKNTTDYISASAYILFEPIKNLIFKFQAGRNLSFYNYKSFTPTYYVGANSVNTIASLYETRSRTTEDLYELVGNYNISLAEKHHLDAMLGVSQEENRFKDLTASASKFENNDLPYLVHGQDNFSVGGGYNRNALRSAFGRLGYNYRYRYMATFSARYDGSSRFGKGNTWGFFPSASFAWNIANEDFWENIKQTMSTFKMRLSYGALGNQAIGNYKFIPELTYNTNNLNYPLNGKDINLGYAVLGLPSTNIKWETTYYQNLGIDLGFWGNKLEVTLDGFIKDTRDMLSTKNISPSTGYGSLIVNEGKLRTTGFELQTIYHGNAGEFNYDLDLNISHYRSVLKEMSDPGYLYEQGPARTYVGGEIGEFWVIKTAGIFQNQEEVNQWNSEHGFKNSNGDWIPLQPSAKPGDIRFIDQNGDGKLDSNDKIKMGSGNPKAAVAFNATLTYKNFDLLANFYGHFGVKRYNGMKRHLERMDKHFNYGKAALDSWRPDNTNTDIPRAVLGDPNGNARISDRFIENGDYLSLNNLQLGYNLPRDLCQKLHIDNLRFYIGATRLFTITSYKGYDPATGAAAGALGVDDALYPLSRTYMVGLKFGF